MQLVAGGNRPDSLADGGAYGAGNPHDDLARRQFAGGGGDALNFLLPGAVNKSFGADAFDRFHGEAERHAAGNCFVRDDEILRANAEDAGLTGAGIPGQLRFDLVGAQRHQIHRRRADEGGDKGGRGLLVDVERIADLLDLATIHDHENIGQRHRLELVVGDVDRGRGQAALQFADFDPHRDAQLGVEVRQRLVKQEHLWLPHDGAAHRHALALAAGQLPRLTLEHRAEFENAGGFPHPRLDLGLGHAAVAQAVGHVVVDGHVWVERVVLEHHRDVAVGRLNLVDDAPADIDLAAGDGLEACDHAQQRGLAAAGRADQHAELAVADVEIDALDGFEATGISFSDITERDVGHGYSTSPSRPD